MKRSCGYILVEAVMAMGLLSVGIVAIQGAMRQSIVVRGQARDYTVARFLAEQKLAEVEIQPVLSESSRSGSFPGEYSRFRWEWKVSRVEVPTPVIPADVPPEQLGQFKLNARYLAKIELVILWKRSGREYKEKIETLYGPEKLFVPEELRR